MPAKENPLPTNSLLDLYCLDQVNRGGDYSSDTRDVIWEQIGQMYPDKLEKVNQLRDHFERATQMRKNKTHITHATSFEWQGVKDSVVHRILSDLFISHAALAFEQGMYIDPFALANDMASELGYKNAFDQNLFDVQPDELLNKLLIENQNTPRRSLVGEIFNQASRFFKKA